MWFCCNRSPSCLIDTLLHEVNIRWGWICDRHDARIRKGGDEPPQGYVDIGVLEDWDD